MHITNSAFMALIFAIGLMLVIVAISIDSDTREGGCSTALVNSNRGVLVIGVAFMVSALSFVVCRYSYSAKGSHSLGFELYYAFMLLLGIVLTALGSIIHKEALSGTSKACKKATSKAPFVWVSGTVMILLCIGYYAVPFIGKQAGQHLAAHQMRFEKKSEM